MTKILPLLKAIGTLFCSLVNCNYQAMTALLEYSGFLVYLLEEKKWWGSSVVGTNIQYYANIEYLIKVLNAHILNLLSILIEAISY